MRMATTLADGILSPDPSMPWLGPLIAIASLLFGGGGVVAFRRLTHDKRIGVAQQETAADDAQANRWKTIIEVQTKALLEPMVTRIGSLEGKVTALENELAASRKKYWSAVTYIRTLLNWINRHMPASSDPEQTIPLAPELLAEDI